MRLNTALSVLILSISSAAFAEEAAAPAAGDESQAVPEHLQKTCLRETGSRIPSRHEDGCLSVHGSAYSNKDLDNTGQALVGEGLWRLDPSLTISRRRNR